MEVMGRDANRTDQTRTELNLKGSKMSKKKEKPTNKQEVKELALKNIKDVLADDREFDEKTQLAMKYLNFESRNEHLEQSRFKLRFTLVKSLADPEIMRKYVFASEPLIKRLPAAS